MLPAADTMPLASAVKIRLRPGTLENPSLFLAGCGPQPRQLTCDDTLVFVRIHHDRACNGDYESQTHDPRRVGYIALVKICSAQTQQALQSKHLNSILCSPVTSMVAIMTTMTHYAINISRHCFFSYRYRAEQAWRMVIPIRTCTPSTPPFKGHASQPHTQST